MSGMTWVTAMPVIVPDTQIEAIDELIDTQIGQLPAKETHLGLPRQTEIKTIAADLAVGIVRGDDPGDDFDGIVIPTFYSGREERLAIARVVASRMLDTAESACRSSADGAHDCPSSALCQLVEDARDGDEVREEIAAAILMPTKDFRKWATLLDTERTPPIGKQERVRRRRKALADSYAVPLDLARRRLKALALED